MVDTAEILQPDRVLSRWRHINTPSQQVYGKDSVCVQERTEIRRRFMDT